MFIGVLPLVLVCAVRVMRAVSVGGQLLKAHWYELGLGAGALVGGGAAWLALHHRPADAFALWPTTAHIITSPAVLPHHLTIAVQGLLLGGADFLGHPPGGATAVLLPHLLGVARAGLGVLAALARFTRGRDLVDDLPVPAVVVNLAIYVLSTLAVAVYYSREIAPVLPFTAVRAARMLADRVLAVRIAPAVLVVILAGHLGVLAPPVAEYPGFTNSKAVRATFGRPADDYHAGPYQVVVYTKNLMADLR
ncbi:MAG: hypothetical protein ACRDOK_21350 [Streptosporangiaceae bacterium]